MKTSSKLLLSLLAFLLIIVTVLIRMAGSNNSGITELSGKVITKNVDSENFSGVDIKGNVKVVLSQGPSKIQLEGDENIISGLKLYVENDILHIQNYISQQNLNVKISSENFTDISISQGAIAESDGPVKGNNLTLSSHTGSQGKLLVEYKKMKCTSSTGSILNLSGVIDDVYFEGSTGSILNSLDLKNKRASINGSLGSIMEINVTEYLTAELSTGSVLKYKGKPEVKGINTSSGGTIAAMD